MNGSHWLLYITRAPECTPNTPPPVNRLLHCAQTNGVKTHWTIDERAATLKALSIDSTIEILMTRLSPSASRAFYFPEGSDLTGTSFDRAREVSSKLGITDLFPPHLTTLDSYAFTPCGYSANALVKWSEVGSSQHTKDQDAVSGGEGYYSIHVTPEDDWSYASFECNVPMSPVPAPHARDIPDLATLMRRVVDIFRPARLTLTLFVSSAGNDETEEEVGESAVEVAQRAFKAALTVNNSTHQGVGDGQVNVYRQTDKINYDFGDYDLAFASFELAT
jgi:S-adenosylmethionine decarboxylase